MELEGVMLTEKKSGREREMLNVFIQMWNLQKPDSQKQRRKIQLPGPRSWGKQGGVGQRVQSSSYKMNKFWESNVQHDDYSEQYLIIYLKPAKSIDLKGYHHTHTHTHRDTHIPTSKRVDVIFPSNPTTTL